MTAEVYATVYCNFTSPWISYTVNFEGFDPASPGGFVHTGLSVQCEKTSRCMNARAGRKAYSCNGKMKHFGVPFGEYATPDGKRHRVAGHGIEGPARTGYVISNYC